METRGKSGIRLTQAIAQSDRRRDAGRLVGSAPAFKRQTGSFEGRSAIRCVYLNVKGEDYAIAIYH
jgi:hypothetical protein